MPLDALTGQLLGGIIGSKQLGAAAPAFQSGVSGFQPGGLLGPEDDEQNMLSQLMQTQSQAPTSLEELLALQPQGQQEIPLAPPVNDTAGIPSLQGMAQQQGQAVGSPGMTPPIAGGGFGEKVGGFFGNLDQNLQSPSKVIGMGLLGQIDPRLAVGGLLAGGLFGKNKLF